MDHSLGRPRRGSLVGKIKDDEQTNYTQVEAEATLVFPLLVAVCFQQIILLFS